MEASASQAPIQGVSGTACVLRGDEIDTDRIIPARFMKVVTFDEVGQHAFADERSAAKGDHSLDDEKYQGASILVVGENFGCGSSREHAPQALMRFGFNAFIGGSFAEIFAGNCTALGLICVTLDEDDLENLMGSVELDPTQTVSIDVAEQTVTSRAGTAVAHIPVGTRKQLMEGTWDAAGMLLDGAQSAAETAARLPYLSGFSK
jgi:3-isopropylmalate/(R)-2-methylmalate dehydratase small subunit